MSRPEALISARQVAARAIAEHVRITLSRMTRDHQAVTFAAVAAKAGVSRQYLYRHPEFAQAIAHMSATQPLPPPAPTEHVPVVVALRGHIRRLESEYHQRLTELRAENADLRRQLQAALGALITQPPAH